MQRMIPPVRQRVDDPLIRIREQGQHLTRHIHDVEDLGELVREKLLLWERVVSHGQQKEVKVIWCAERPNVLNGYKGLANVASCAHLKHKCNQKCGIIADVIIEQAIKKWEIWGVWNYQKLSEDMALSNKWLKVHVLKDLQMFKNSIVAGTARQSELCVDSNKERR